MKNLRTEISNKLNREINELMDPKVDFVFKSLFGNEKHPKVLISFLNAVLGYSKNNHNAKYITQVKIENPEITKSMVEDKYSVLDIKATLNDNEIVNIEIQIKDPKSMVNRLLYYLSKLYSNQLTEGKYYNNLKRCISIGILNFDLIDNQYYHNTFNFRDNHENKVLSDVLELHTIELKKLTRDKNLENHDLLVDWLLFISNPIGKDVKLLQEKIPEIKEAMEVLEMLSHDKKAREIYEQRFKARMDKESILYEYRKEGLEQGIQEGLLKGIQEGLQKGMNEGLQKGMHEGLQKGMHEGLQKGLQKGGHDMQIKIAQSLFATGLSDNIIADSTGLSIPTVKKLRSATSSELKK